MTTETYDQMDGLEDGKRPGQARLVTDEGQLEHVIGVE